MTSGLSVEVKVQSPAEKALITSALNLFVIQNEVHVSVSQLLQVTGISKATFYKHFANKEDLYAAILLNDEMSLSKLLKDIKTYGNVSQLLSEFLKYRIQQIEKLRLLTRLEKHLRNANSDVDRFLQWKLLRQSHYQEFVAIIQAKNEDEHALDRETINYYYALIVVLTRGLSDLSESEHFQELVSDKRGFIQFLLNSIEKTGEIS